MANATMTKPAFAWLNGEIVPWDQCVVHARAQGAFWGANVFEGLRAYWCPDAGQLYTFRVDDHLARLCRSMKGMRMEIAHSEADLATAVQELLRANEYREDVHVTVMAYFGIGPNFDPMALTDDSGVHITAIPAPRSAAYHAGAAATISTWRRLSDDTMPPRIKAGANYQNSRLAHQEARRNGYDAALILNQRGTVSEAPGACVMMVRDGRLVTPPGTSGVLEGITVATVAELARDLLNLELDTREIDRTELYAAQEVFLAGTLAEILPITSLDRLPVGDGAVGRVTRRLQEAYGEVTHGLAGRPRWLTPAYGKEPLTPFLAAAGRPV
jgi:branched-chain amino acid aminotransferase